MHVLVFRSLLYVLRGISVCTPSQAANSVSCEEFLFFNFTKYGRLQKVQSERSIHDYFDVMNQHSLQPSQA